MTAISAAPQRAIQNRPSDSAEETEATREPMPRDISDDPRAHNDQGNLLRKRGKLEEAEQAYRRALELDPSFPEAHSNLGVVLQDRRRYDEARACYEEALRLRPDYADAHNNLGSVHKIQKRDIEAERSFREALRLDPNSLLTLNNLGNLCREAKRFDEARQAFEETIRRDPHYAIGHNNLGVTFQDQGKFDEALRCYTRAIELNPAYVDAHNNLGTVYKIQGKLPEALAAYEQAIHHSPKFAAAYSNLGNVYQAMRKWADAQRCFEQALEIRPQYAEAHNNLGVVFQDQDRLDDAGRCYRRAMEIKPDYAEAHNNLGTVLKASGDFLGAQTCYEQALRIKADYAEAHNNLGNILRDFGRLEEALTCYRHAIEYKPDYADAQFHLSLVWLLQGDFEQGWPAYEWRWKAKDGRLGKFEQPMWDGSPLDGKTILLHSEQGLGDTLQFVRYAKVLQDRGAKVVVRCQKVLAPLLARTPGIDQLVPDGAELPPFDVHAPLLSAPGLLKTDFTSLPAEVPYLFTDDALIQKWREELQSLKGLKIGISWQGNPKFRHDKWRSFPLKNFERIARVEGVTLVSLQKKAGVEQLQDFKGTVVDWTDRMDEGAGAFMDTAAVMKGLDLVITSDTAVAHLAGGLGVPVWLATPYACDWRWLLEREDCPWYPSMRLFRQQEVYNWESVFEAMAQALEPLVRAQRGTGSALQADIAPGELIDKITILEIKDERITDPDKLYNVRVELATLCGVRDQGVKNSDRLETLTAELKQINLALWEIEDEIRECERRQDFGARFIELARAVYFTNDRRAAVKRQINELLGSALIEEKAYASYAPGQAAPEAQAAPRHANNAPRLAPSRSGSAPQISVVLPVRNAERTLERAIRSVMAQSFDNWELLVVDDGSTDRSWDILRRLAALDARIRPLRSKQPRGAAAARNHALRLAQGEQITYVGADEEYYPDYLKRVSGRRENQVVIFAYDYYDQDAAEAPARFSETWQPTQHKEKLLKEPIFGAMGIAHHRELLRQTGLFDETLDSLEDWDLWKRMARTRHPFVFTTEKSGRTFRVVAPAPTVPEQQLPPESPKTATSPAVSVIMPVHNGAKHLPRSIGSILAQDFADWELIAVDDGSTDDSHAKLLEWATRDHRIRVLRLEVNSGPSAARNAALREAKGRMIAYLDCDDEYLPDHLGQVAAHFEQGDVVFFAYEIHTERSKGRSKSFSHVWDPVKHRDRIAEVNPSVPLGVTHRREILERTGLFDETRFYEEDWDLWKRFAEEGARFVYTSKVCGRYYVRKQSQARTKRVPTAHQQQVRSEANVPAHA